jgi:hypothetical protein
LLGKVQGIRICENKIDISIFLKVPFFFLRSRLLRIFRDDPHLIFFHVIKLVETNISYADATIFRSAVPKIWAIKICPLLSMELFEILSSSQFTALVPKFAASVSGAVRPRTAELYYELWHRLLLYTPGTSFLYSIRKTLNNIFG